ncbi:MAG: Holliday junction resolvase RuvX [Melioribacter sp.]|uniref:Holliday junction resolvase RuvX n=1 Tax=Rosettibacter primus TaxID=3111523 RepID=UPI00247D79CF|nr:Holliday junction resolvase RuvX [Melioribacter sp.]
MNQQNEARILAIDYGEKRIGLAITDPLNIFAYPLITIENNKNLWTELEKIIRNYNVKKIILGNPLKESGAESRIFPLIKKFKEEVEKKFQLSVELVDERYSSIIAKKRIVESVSSRKKRREKGLLDKNSAAVLLEDYLREISIANK